MTSQVAASPSGWNLSVPASMVLFPTSVPSELDNVTVAVPVTPGARTSTIPQDCPSPESYSTTLPLIGCATCESSVPTRNSLPPSVESTLR